MCHVHQDFNLGFGNFTCEPGIHICQIYNDSEERFSTLKKYISGGGSSGEKIACFIDTADAVRLHDYLEAEDSVYKPGDGKIAIFDPNEVYFENNLFSPELMLGRLKEFYDTAMVEGFPAARVIGEMMSTVEKIDGGSRLAEYESRVSLLQRESPVTTVCQYNAEEFTGTTIMEILQVHPYLLSGGEIIVNPLYIPPETFLKTLGSTGA